MFSWRKNSQSLQKPVPTNDDVQNILTSLQSALGEDNQIYEILIKYVDRKMSLKASLEEQCAAIYEGISDLLSATELITSDMLRNVQTLKVELEGLNFTRTNDKDRENIFSGYLLQRQLVQFFEQPRIAQKNVQTLPRSCQILLTMLMNFLEQDNDQLIKSMVVLINFVAKNDQKKLKSLNFPSYEYKNPNATKTSPSFEHVLTEIKMNISDSDIEQLFDPVNKLPVDDDVKFRILRGLLSCLEDQAYEETYSTFIDLLLSGDNADDALKKINEFKDPLSETVQASNLRFDTIMRTISGYLEYIRNNLNIVSGYDSKVKELNNSFEQLQCDKGVDEKVDNANSTVSIKQLSEEQIKMGEVILRALELSGNVKEVYDEMVKKVTKRDEQLDDMNRIQLNLAKQRQLLEEFKSELESLPRQVDTGELVEQINSLLDKTLYIKYLNSDEELRKMKCDDVDSDIRLLQEFNENFKDVEQNVIKIKEAIEHKQELEQIILQAKDLCDQTESLLEKLKKVQQGFIGFIVDELKQIKMRLVKYQEGQKWRNPKGAKKEVTCLPNKICPIHEQKIKMLDKSLQRVEKLDETMDLQFISIENFNEVIELLGSNPSDLPIDERFTKFWSIEIERLKKIQEYLQILNINPEEYTNLTSQLSIVETWLSNNKSFVDSNVDFNSKEIYIKALRTGKEVVSQTEKCLNSMKKFLKEAIEKIKKKINDLQSEYDRRFDKINSEQLRQHGTQVCINDQSNRLKKSLCTEFQILEQQLRKGKKLSIEDCQFLDKIANLFTGESKLSFDEWINSIDSGVKLAANTIAHNSEVAVIVSNFVANFVNDHKKEVEAYRGLVCSYEEKEQQLKELRTELYVIDEQREQPKEILKILQINLGDMIDFGNCESFLQNHAQAFMTSPPKLSSNLPLEEEECDKRSMCSLM